MTGKEERKRKLADHPNAWASGCIREHRLKAATALGHALPAFAVVHHFGDQLVICQDDIYHRYIEIRQRAFLASGDAHKRRCGICGVYDDTVNLVYRQIDGRHRFHHRKCFNEKEKRLYKARMKRMADAYAAANHLE